MGYRSKVGIVCGKNVAKKINAVLNDEDPQIRPWREYFIYEWDWTKWYEDDPTYYPEVDAIMKILNEFCDDAYDDTSDNAFCYLRIGEDGGDSDYMSNTAGEEISWYFYIKRDIVFPDQE